MKADKLPTIRGPEDLIQMLDHLFAECGRIRDRLDARQDAPLSRAFYARSADRIGNCRKAVCEHLEAI